MLTREKPIHIVAVALLLIAVQIIVIAEYFGIQNRTAKPDEQYIFCTQEAKQCPDGSYVSRTGPNCEFAECAKPSIAQIDASDWKTYRNKKYGFEVKYPNDWKVEEGSVQLATKPQLIFSTRFHPVDIMIRVYKNEQYLPVREWYSVFLEGKEFSREGKRKATETVIDNLKALEISSSVMGDRAIRTYLPLDDKIIGIEFMATGPNINSADLNLYNSFRATLRIK